MLFRFYHLIENAKKKFQQKQFRIMYESGRGIAHSLIGRGGRGQPFREIPAVNVAVLIWEDTERRIPVEIGILDILSLFAKIEFSPNPTQRLLCTNCRKSRSREENVCWITKSIPVILAPPKYQWQDEMSNACRNLLIVPINCAWPTKPKTGGGRGAANYAIRKDRKSMRKLCEKECDVFFPVPTTFFPPIIWSLTARMQKESKPGQQWCETCNTIHRYITIDGDGKKVFNILPPGIVVLAQKKQFQSFQIIFNAGLFFLPTVIHILYIHLPKVL